MFELVTNALALIFVLGVLVFVHEFGHFAMAKAFGIGVEVFSLGFGRRLFGVRRGGTDYRVSALPLGGYVKMLGENPDEVLTGSDEEYLSKPKWQRLCVLVAGPAMNIVLAFALTVAVFQIGVRVQADADAPVTVGLVEAGSPAASAGLRPGDRIVSVDGEPMPDWERFRLRVMISAGEPLELGVVRDGRELTLTVVPATVGQQRTGRIGVASPLPPLVGQVLPDGPAERAGLRPGDRIVAVDGRAVSHYNTLFEAIEAAGGPVTLSIERSGERLELSFAPERDPQGRLLVGFGPDPAAIVKLRRYPLGEAVVRAADELWRQASLLGEIVGRLFTGRMSVRTLSGPIEIARFSGGAARTGDPAVLLSFMAFISLQLGLLNLLLPIPVLDGGQIALILFEWAIRRDLSMQVKERIMQIGLILVVSLMVLVLSLDISKAIPDSWWRALPF